MSMAMQHAMRKRMAKGGMAKCAHGMESGCEMCHGGAMADGGPVLDPAGIKSIKDAFRNKSMADGGEMMGDDDLVMRIMKKRYAHGGEVEPVADFESNDFDEMDKEPAEEFSYNDENSGDEDGDKALDDEDKDVVGRIMKSRSKKDRMPRPA